MGGGVVQNIIGSITYEAHNVSGFKIYGAHNVWGYMH